MKKSWFVVAAAIPLVVVGSIAMWELAGDDTRRAGALEPLEKPLPLAWRGAWAEDASYDVGHVVSYQGSSYVAQGANAGEAPSPEEGSWALLAATGLQGPQGPQGPPGSGLSTLDALDGRPCNVGQATEGVAEVVYDSATEAVTLKCEPTNLVRLTVVATPAAEEYECGAMGQYTCYITRPMTITGSVGSTDLGSCQSSGRSARTCLWLVTKSATVTLKGSPGVWDGGCYGTTADCSIVMSADRSVGKIAD